MYYPSSLPCNYEKSTVFLLLTLLINKKKYYYYIFMYILNQGRSQFRPTGPWAVTEFWALGPDFLLNFSYLARAWPAINF